MDLRFDFVFISRQIYHQKKRREQSLWQEKVKIFIKEKTDAGKDGIFEEENIDERNPHP